MLQNDHKCKVLALYLPQYHQIPENDAWWGEGFTEWNVVKAAKKISRYTCHPKVPLDGYYDLSDVKSIKRQAELARKHGVDGFVMYSYYSNGQTLLEKPSQLLLENPDIDIQYCFSWANHDWRRTWFSYNKELLREQKYAQSEQDLEMHFQYLLPFFKDPRYIRYDGKPVMVIYNTHEFSDIKRYRETWNKLAVQAGLGGIWFVQTLGGKVVTWDKENFDACFDFEPTYTLYSYMGKYFKINRIRRAIGRRIKANWVARYFNYNTVCRIMEKNASDDPNHWLGSFAGWDNTPRHSVNGTVYTHFSMKRFAKNFKHQLKKSIDGGKPFLILDAWNEWGEGAFLEPDEQYGYEKLETICKVVNEINN